MKSVQTNQRFSLQELLDFFRPHSLKLSGSKADSNLVPLCRASLVKNLSAPTAGIYRERTVYYVKSGTQSDTETLAAMHKGEDVIVGGVLQSENCQVNPPFLVRKSGLHSRAGRFHYEVWACLDRAPTDPTLLLELCASVEALNEKIGAIPRLVRIAIVDGTVYDFDTRALMLMYNKIKELFFASRPLEFDCCQPVSSLVSFPKPKTAKANFPLVENKNSNLA